MPVRGGEIELSWERDGDTLRYKASAPAGYSIRVENPAGPKLVRV
jgi:hypothetical protein